MVQAIMSLLNEPNFAGEGSVLLNFKDNRGYTPLHLAASENQEEIVRILLAAKANPNASDADGARPLHIACGNG